MKRYFGLFGLLLLLALAVMPSLASADASHVRIVRLSLVQGDVRFTRGFQGDPLTDSNTVWETAALNLPLREGYVLATNNGRAEVEFESGAMAFLSANTVVEFYDLSLHDGGRITRLVLRQGTAIFYVNPTTGDYFSVTGGDYTVEASGRTTFRLDNFDDGSTVEVQQGHVAVLRNDTSTPLEKGQSLSVQAGKAGNMTIGRLAESDDFDHWVSGRIESVVTATNYSAQYVSSPNYTSGFGDLYTYGSWFSVGGYGNCWRPFGVGLGWSPFSIGSWYLDPVFGWSFIGSAPWGWLPYHYGGWIFSPVYGWVWAPAGFGIGRPVHYRPVTAVWVRSGSTLGVVPVHPGDKNGKTPVNLGQGVFPVQSRGIAQPVAVNSGEKWSVLREAPHDALAGGLETSTSPTRVSRTILTGANGNRPVTLTRESSIVYDAHEHRFVNGANSSNSANGAGATNEMKTAAGNVGKTLPPNAAVIRPANGPAMPTSTRAVLPPRAPAMPAPARTGGSGSNGSSGGGTVWGGSRGVSTGSSHPASAGSSHPSSGGSARAH